MEATYFEVATALAFLCFAESGVEDAVVETGLGGRLDATNVVTPSVCVITSLAADHVEYLGSSLQSIAREKAGILKPGVPAVLPPVAPSAYRVIEEVSTGLGAPLRLLGREASIESVALDPTCTSFVYRSDGVPTGESLRTSLIGRHQAENAGLALLALESWPRWPGLEAVREGLAEVKLPGRFQVVTGSDGPWVFDIAHNTAAVRRLADTLTELRLPLPCVGLVSVLRDKPWAEMASALSRVCQSAVLTIAPSAPPERRWTLDHALLEGQWRHVEASADFERAVRRARELAGAGTVLVTGSAHTVGDALGLLTE